MNMIHHQDGQPNDSALARVKKCQHNVLPSFDHSQEYGYVLSCHSGHEAIGDSLDKVVDHWNHLIAFFNRELAEHLADNGVGRKDQSYCVRCQANTMTDVIQRGNIYRAECMLCRFDKTRGSK